MFKFVSKGLRGCASLGMATLIACGAALTAGTAEAQEMLLAIDQTAPVKLDRPAATVVIGNSQIAEVTAHSANVFFVVGRNMGTTNVVAVDSSGATIADLMVHVTSPGERRVVLHRADQRFSYSCADNCEWVQMPGDGMVGYAEIDEENKRKFERAQDAKKASSNAGQ